MAYLEPLFTGDVKDLESAPVRSTTIAPGNYKACIIVEDVKTNEDNGKYLYLELEIVEGENKGIVLKDFITLTSQEGWKQEAGQAKKARLGDSTIGNGNFGDSKMIRNKIVIIEVATKANNYTNKQGEAVKGTKNFINWYHPAGTAPKAAPGIAHSTITNGAGGVYTTPVTELDDSIPF
jgi:hypothetical protein